MGPDSPNRHALVAAWHEFIDTHVASRVTFFMTQSLRLWACCDCGPIRPRGIGRPLRWRVVDLARLFNGEAQ